jgi:D,D-heptose 1,7-bisphosphate phosphatase
VQPAIFLDRDNTLIANEGDLGEPEQVRLVDGVPAGLKKLRDAGYNLIVVTNQAGVARGKFTEEGVDAVHQRIALMVDQQAGSSAVIDRFYYCPYHPEATVPEYKRDHPWRKPHPGMILQAARDMEIDLPSSWMIGDQERDVLAGRAAGCRTILISRDAELAKRAEPTAVAASFGEAVRLILRGNGQLTAARSARDQPERKPPTPNSPQKSQQGGVGGEQSDIAGIRRSISELIEEIRSDRLRRTEFTPVRMIAGVCQLLAFVLALLGLLQLSNSDVYMKWMIGAGLAQLVTVTLLVLDLKS